jgi:DNA-binding HxlR family transcriptional regulator
MPLGSDYAGQSCALARALTILGERWTLLIVRDAFHGLTRYDEFLRSLGLATNVLTARLQKLVEHGVLERTGPRTSYHLTQKGRDLFPVVLTLMAWADRYEQGPAGPEVLILHTGCDHEVGGALRCEHCGESIALRDLRVVPARGAVGSDGKPTTLTPPQLAAWEGRSAQHCGLGAFR